MKVDKAGIYVDAYQLRKVLKRAQYLMSKADRVIYGTPVLEKCGEFLSAFVMAYDFKEERNYYIRKMCASFELLKIDLRIIMEDNVLRASNPEPARMSADGYKVRIYELIARIDEGILKWRNSMVVKSGIASNDVSTENK